MNKEKTISVGILANEKVEFQLLNNFQIEETKTILTKETYLASLNNNKVSVYSKGMLVAEAFEVVLAPISDNGTFILEQVTIGIDFHWEQQEVQQFSGALKLVQEENKVRAINLVGIEKYLQSVVSSEMSPHASLEFLKAHAVISRSWVLAQIQKKKKPAKPNKKTPASQDEHIIWYDSEGHNLFDVCADDHCQRYQGISKISSEKAIEAVVQTKGEVLAFNGEICDTRFSKCCGGLSENFENVWEPTYYPYLSKVVDSEYGNTTCVDLRKEKEAEQWITSKPYAFCNTDDPAILPQMLPGFDQQTTDFYRWQVVYSQKEIASIIKKKSAIDFGEVIKLEAIKRGHSARIIKLKIIGTNKEMIIGKELEIRKWLSESHLYSSAFVVDYLDFENNVPQKFVLTGAGWGHGVGLCQIGAAAMGEKGYSYKEILNHYFQRAEIENYFKLKISGSEH